MTPRHFPATLILLLLAGAANPSAVLAQSSQGYEAPLRRLSDEIVTGVQKNGLSRIAILDFADLDGNVTQLGRFLAEELTTSLVMSEKRFAVVDRANLRRIMDEHKLTASGLVDPANAKTLGRLAGVDALVIGTLTDLAEEQRLSLKVISTETATILAAARTSIPRIASMSKLSDVIGLPLAGSSRFQEFPQLRVEVTRLQGSSNGAVTVFLKYANKTKDNLKLVLCEGFCGDNKTFLLRGDGTRYGLRGASGIAKCCYGLYGGDWAGGILELPAAGEATATLEFSGGRGAPSPDDTFAFSSEQMLGEVVRSQWKSTRTLSIAIQGVMAAKSVGDRSR